MKAIDHTDMHAILAKVKEISEGERNPKNQKKGHSEKRCCGGAFPMDLGSKGTDQRLTRAMYKLASNSYLELVDTGPGLPMFKLTKKGEEYLEQNK